LGFWNEPQQHAPLADLLVAGQRLVPEVEQVVVQRHNLLHVLDVLHQPDQVVREELLRGHGADAAGVECRGVDVAALHEAEHFARQPAHDEGFAVELAGERVERRHDVGDGAVLVQVRVRGGRPLRLVPDLGVGLLDHLLAEVHADQIFLEEAVVEHVLGGLAEVDDPLAQIRRADAEGHVLGVAGAGGVVVAADAADAAGDEVRVARVLALHEDAVTAKDRRRTVALGDLAVGEVDLGVDAQAADDARDRVPGHLDQFAGLGRGGALRRGHGRHDVLLRREIRMSKSETNPNHRNPKRQAGGFGHWDFGF
jgi:hypothetical protein